MEILLLLLLIITTTTTTTTTIMLIEATPTMKTNRYTNPLAAHTSKLHPFCIAVGLWTVRTRECVLTSIIVVDQVGVG